MSQKNNKSLTEIPIIDTINSIWDFGNMVVDIGEWVAGLDSSDSDVNNANMDMLINMQNQLNGMDSSIQEIIAGNNLTQAQITILKNMVAQNAIALNEISDKIDNLQSVIIKGFAMIQSALSQIQMQNAAIQKMLFNVLETLEVLNKKLDILQASIGYSTSYNSIISPTQKLKYTNNKLNTLVDSNNNSNDDMSDEDIINKFLLLQDFAKDVSNPGQNGLEAALDALYNATIGSELLTSSLIDSSFQLLLKTDTTKDQAEKDIYRVVTSLLNIFVTGYGTLATCQMLVNRPVVDTEVSKNRVEDIINKLIYTLKVNSNSSIYDKKLELTDYEALNYGGSTLEVHASSDDKVIIGLEVTDNEDGLNILVRSAKILKNYKIDEHSIEENSFPIFPIAYNTARTLTSKAKRNGAGLTELLAGFTIDDFEKTVKVLWISYDPNTGNLGEIRSDSAIYSQDQYDMNAEIPFYYGKLGGNTNFYSGLDISTGDQIKLTAYTLESTSDSEVLNALEDKTDFIKFGNA
ncbi:vegetative insecticidal protein Vip3A family protein [Pediococcus pentosaceus]|uniref:vegetative insecticidal protein Vip3A family protein n=2 Tax=Pediococcus pentosaceus TaxID=1255 RepID=UPI003163941E